MRLGFGLHLGQGCVAGPSVPAFVASSYGTVERELRADSGVTKDGSNRISVVADQSGNGRNWSQATTANQPTWTASDGNFNAQPTIAFAGSTSPNNAFLEFASFGSLAGADMFCVLRVNEDPAVTTSNDISGLTTDGGSPREVYPFTDGNIYIGWGSNVRKSCGRAPLAAGALQTAHVLHIRSRSNDWFLKVNGTTVFGTATNAVAWPAAPRIGSSSTDQPWKGQIAHWVCYSTLTNEAGVVASLKARYGIA